MQRCTIHLLPDNDWIGPESTQKILYSELSKEMGTLEVTNVRLKDDRVVAQLRTDIKPSDMRELVSPLETRLHARFKDAGWGWPDDVPQDIYQSLPLKEERPPFPDERDRFKDVAIQTEPSHSYTVWPVQTGYLVLAPVVFGIVAASNIQYWWPYWVIMVITLLFVQFHRVTCDPQGLIVRYWVRSAQYILWEQIHGARIVTLRGGHTCYLDMQGVRIPGLINFRVGAFEGSRTRIGDGDVLFKTIQKRARLNYVGGTLLSAATYKRFDAA